MATPVETVRDREKPFVDRALRVLAAARLRVTRPRRALIELLERELRPMSASEGHRLLKKRGTPVDLATVHRTLGLLARAGLVHRVATVDGYVRCRLEDAGAPCHHPVVCRACETVTETSCEGPGLIAVKAAAEGFVSDGHTIELVGVCASCVAEGRSTQA